MSVHCHLLYCEQSSQCHKTSDLLYCEQSSQCHNTREFRLCGEPEPPHPINNKRCFFLTYVDADANALPSHYQWTPWCLLLLPAQSPLLWLLLCSCTHTCRNLFSDVLCLFFATTLASQHNDYTMQCTLETEHLYFCILGPRRRVTVPL